jgi:Lon protease-like protein
VEWDVVTAAPAPALINSLCMALPFAPLEKQALLEAPDLDERRVALAALMEIAAAGPVIDDDDDATPFLQ